MATHDTAPWIGRMRVLRKTQNHGQECPARGYFRSRASEAQRRCGLGLVLQPPCPCIATAARAGWVPSSRNMATILGALALPHDDRAVIENQILDPQLQTLTDPHARSIQKLGEQRCSPSRNRGCEPLHPGSAPPASAATAEVFRSPEARADPHSTCRRRTARPPMPDDAWRPKPCARSPARTEMPRLRCCPRLPGDAHRETDEGTNPVDISLFGW